MASASGATGSASRSGTLASRSFTHPSGTQKASLGPFRRVRYGVVVCPHCGNARGVELADETAKCPRCRKGLHVKALKVFASTDSPGQLPTLVGRVQAQVTNAPAQVNELPNKDVLEDYDPMVHDSPMQFAAGVGRKHVSTEVRAEMVARALAKALGKFSERELYEAWRDSAIDDDRLDDERRRLLVRGVLYEPKPGVYSLLG